VTFFLASDLEEIPEGAASFRSLSRMTAAQRNSAVAAGTLALALDDWITARFRLPNPDVPRLGPRIEPETAAEAVRAEWALGEQPISNMIHLLESRGIRVFSLAERSREVDAFSLWRNGTPYIFLNMQKSAEHSRLDAAHELGHLVMHSHHDLPQGREVEREAQAFGSAFLMPRAGMMASAPRFASLPELFGHKKHWRVSLAAYIYRLHTLGSITEWQYRTLNVELSKRGYRTKEPHGVQRETSQVLNKVFGGLRAEGMSTADVAGALHIESRDLDELIFGLAMLPLDGDGRQAPSAPATPPVLRLVDGGVSD
jgi:Zn-dependent peptidase ImmA (M78 family)